MSKDPQEDVLERMRHAKLNPDDFHPMVQQVFFSSTLNEESLFVFEMENSMLQLLKTGEKLVFKGDPTDYCVLCSNKDTFAIREAETSNNLLLSPDLITLAKGKSTEDLSIHAATVNSMRHTYFEVKHTIPSMNRTKILLEEQLFIDHLEIEDPSAMEKTFTIEELCSKVQSSQRELFHYLYRLEAYLVENHVRLLDFSYRVKLDSAVMDTILLNDWPLTRVPVAKVVQELKQVYPEELVSQTVIYLSEQIDHYAPRSAVPAFCLNLDENSEVAMSEGRVCRQIALALLRNNSRFNSAEFASVWENLVPQGIHPNVQRHLRGWAIEDVDCVGGQMATFLTYFSNLDLPEAIEERMDALFSRKRQWRQEEIMPYLEDVLPPDTSVSSLLTKWSRVMHVNGERFYVSRKLKAT